MWTDITWLNTLINILLALGVCGVVALLLDVLLGLISHFFAVKEDETAKAIRDCLPGVNCGACGYKGCDDYAAAVAEGTAAPNLCVPGAEAVAQELGEIMGVEVETPEDLNTVTIKEPTQQEIEDMLFANKIVKHSKSNAIVLAKDKQLIASGVGQTSRVDSLRHAVEKAGTFGFSLQGAVMASDAFFPFPDCVQIAHEAGITAVIHPGGSIRDKESVDYCDAHEVSMVTTGFRHFKH